MLLSAKSRKRAADYTNKMMDQVMQRLNTRRLRCWIPDLLRHRAATASANDNLAVSAPVPANDNRAAVLPTKYACPTFRGSYLSVIQGGQGGRSVILTIAKADTSNLKIRAGQYVLASVKVLIDPYFATKVQAVSVRRVPHTTQGAVQVEANGEGFRIRVRDAHASPYSSQEVYLSPVQYQPDSNKKAVDLFLPWHKRQLALEDLKTLKHTTQTGLARRLLLAKWTVPEAKGAGDECYTLAFIYQWGLKAARRSMYDLDACSMSATGHYEAPLSEDARRMIPLSVIPAQHHHNIEAQLVPLPARKRYTAEGPFGSLTRSWDGRLIWINPPYNGRLWACFMERAHREVERDKRKIFLTLGPNDNCGPHAASLYGRYACQIPLERQLPFYKVRISSIETIRNNQIVVFGRGIKMQRFLRSLATIMHADGAISAEQKAKIIRESWLYLL
ncbi:hypothetical protein AA106555_1853 [Neokomagataea thailandica NBRC 106555]|uniref:Uncharacterized protein n=2 Tax=Neokomagataea TaxID=1223423 RepID=A0A4Y6V3I1_9PROT|nr:MULTISPECIES: hypothetical protein [Neokomagataea]QDH24619.1 hypothetical protein D5366_04470 [Neokomagataea tanensis]GBR54902.1 hypothetical protein AA106555_1853 [Neokomagataea thailandica NBRC 106555]